MNLYREITEENAKSEDKSNEEDTEAYKKLYGCIVKRKLDLVDDDLFSGIEERPKIKRKEIAYQELYENTVKRSRSGVNKVLSTGVVTVTDKIFNNGNTALHVAVGTSMDPEFFKEMLEKTPKNISPTGLINSDGSTLLHIAATVGNIEAAEILMDKYPDMLYKTDNEGQTPLVVALSNMHSKVYWDLLELIKKKPSIRRDTLFTEKLLELAISYKDFYLARNLIWWWCRKLDSDVVLMAIAQNYPCELSFWERRAAVLPFVKRRLQKRHEAFQVLKSVCEEIKKSSDHKKYYTKPVLEATRLNALEVVKVLVYHFPDAFWSKSVDGHNVIQYAVINRSEKIYNLLYHMSEHKNVYKTIKDASRNNLLHLAARMAPSEKLNPISGAALQIQYELQWYEEVKSFVCPLNITEKNSSQETPQMVFTSTHKALVSDGEKWMKSTAESYTITAALITTIVFAAAITVPGGNTEHTGVPIFTNNPAFTIFALSDAISLFTAVMSLLMFLSILTARFAEQDFLYKLPTRLIIGLVTLFISTTTMIIAFGAALFIVFGQNNGSLLIPIGALTGLTITFFVALQFPLVVDLMRTTYGRSIFAVIPNEWQTGDWSFELIVSFCNLSGVDGLQLANQWKKMRILTTMNYPIPTQIDHKQNALSSQARNLAIGTNYKVIGRALQRVNKCTIEFDEFGFPVKDFFTRHIILRCDSFGDLYPVTTPSPIPSAMLSISLSTWHQRLGHPGEEVLRSLASSNTFLVIKRSLIIFAMLVNLFTSLPTPQPTRSYPMVTRSQVGTDPHWRDAMSDEYNVLIKNNTWVLILRPPSVNVVCSMWLFRHKYYADGTLSRYKARLVANGSSQQLGYDTRVGFSHSRCDSSLFIYRHGTEIAYLLIYVDDIVLTASSTALLQRIISSLHREFEMTDLDTESKLGPEGDPVSDLMLYRNLASSLQYLTFTRLDLSYVVQQVCLYMHDPREPHMTTLKRILRYVREYVGVAKAMLNRRLRNLLLELHTPLQTATLVYCDNLSAIYLSANPVQHQRMKNIEIDIHFVRDMVTQGHVCVLHVPSRYQYAEIFTKGFNILLHWLIPKKVLRATAFSEKTMSSPNHSTSDIEDTFSFMNILNYTSVSSDYFPASSGSSSLNSSENSKDNMITPIFSPFYNNPYLKDVQAFYAKESPVSPPASITP
ncbi:ankyrin repeat-containing domain, PGG domain protein [Tanacetum coccineum]